jgi:hypothetical protein
MVSVDISGRDRLDAEVLREVAEQRVPMRVDTLERSLELDEEVRRCTSAASGLTRRSTQ